MEFIMRNRYLRKGTKSRIYKAIVRPIMIYSLVTRADTKKN
jgi:hypothetical protein